MATNYRLISAAGVDMGIWEARDAQDALDLCARDQGYRSLAHQEEISGPWTGRVIEVDVGPAYAIESRSATSREWHRDVGDPRANRFADASEAEEAIESLRDLGDEWATAEYRVVVL